MAPPFRRFAKPFRAKQETAKQGSGETKQLRGSQRRAVLERRKGDRGVKDWRLDELEERAAQLGLEARRHERDFGRCRLALTAAVAADDTIALTRALRRETAARHRIEAERDRLLAGNAPIDEERKRRLAAVA